MKVRHKWADVINGWADGVEVECKHIFVKDSHWGPWNEEESPIDWNSPDYIFRLKVDPVITVKYYKKVPVTRINNGNAVTRTDYIEFEPDLEEWDLRITYEDDRVIDTEHV